MQPPASLMFTLVLERSWCLLGENVSLWIPAT